MPFDLPQSVRTRIALANDLSRMKQPAFDWRSGIHVFLIL
jgi:hypothetical protein